LEGVLGNCVAAETEAIGKT